MKKIILLFIAAVAVLVVCNKMQKQKTAAIGIIGGADGPTAIFVAHKGKGKFNG